jgi:hypothetical protein
MRRTMTWIPTLIVLIGVVPTRTAAQPARSDSAGAQPAARRFCFRGRRAPACHRFLLVEGGFYKPVRNTIRTLPSPADRDDPRRQIPGAFGNHGTWEIGAMANVDRKSALGATALWGAGGVGSFRTGVRARYRLWLDDTTSVEVATGPVWMAVNDARGAGGLVVTTDLRLNVSDKYALSGRLDRVQSRNFAAGHAAYIGASLGSKYTLVATGVGIVLVLIGVMVAVAGTN